MYPTHPIASVRPYARNGHAAIKIPPRNPAGPRATKPYDEGSDWERQNGSQDMYR